MARRVLLALLLILVIATMALAAFTWREEIAPIEPPARSAFDTASISRGAHLAAIGNCITCHTAAQGPSYAGGFPLRTQFGTIYGTNITPDPETGIGRWSSAAFARAMREGADRRGRHLYPAFPYDHFTLLGDEDLDSLYAFLMTREPVRAQTPANDLIFPLNLRFLLAGWKVLFLDRGAFRPDPAQSDEWNRGAYLVHGLGHCGACHTPRNALGAEKRKQYFAGAHVEGWYAPALDASSRAPVSWTAETLFTYLRHGSSAQHSVAAGPMAPVVHNLHTVSESDVRAIATYIATVIGPPTAERQRRAAQVLETARTGVIHPDASAPGPQRQPRVSAETRREGATLYAASCAVCHVSAARAPGASSAEALHLSLSSALSLPTPTNLIRIILAGMAPPDGEPGPFMPGYAGAYTDSQVASLVSYLRASYTDRAEWQGLEREVRNVRHDMAREQR